MYSPQLPDSETLVKFPKIYHKSKSTSSGTKSSVSLQDSISAKSWLYCTSSSQSGFRSNTKRQIASLTKIMTTICSLQICQKYNMNLKGTYFKITQWAASINGTSANLQANAWMNVEDLLYGMMLPSGNDAALTLAENLGAVLYFDKSGNKEMIQQIRSIDLAEDYDSVKYYMQEFLNYMNQKCKILKMNKTKFANPHGLDHISNYSCCQDVLIMSQEGMKNELFRQIVKTTKYKGTFKTFKQKRIICKYITWINTNKLLDRDEFVMGVKTGITPKAGGCLSTFFKINQNVQGVIIVLGCSSAQSRFKDTQTILNYIAEQIDNNF